MHLLGIIHLLSVMILVIFALSVLAYHCKSWYIILAISIPLVIGFTYSTALTIEGLKGYPSTYIMNSNKYLFISYTMDKKKTWIFVWAEPLNLDEPYSFKIPYSKDLEKELKSAKDKTQHGVPVIFGPNTNRKPVMHTGQSSVAEQNRKSLFEFYNLPYSPDTLKPERTPQNE